MRHIVSKQKQSGWLLRNDIQGYPQASKHIVAQMDVHLHTCTDKPPHTINYLCWSFMLLKKTEPHEKGLSNHINSNSKELDLIFRLIYNNKKGTNTEKLSITESRITISRIVNIITWS